MSNGTEVCRLRSVENLVSDAKEFIFDVFVYLKPMKRFENRGGVCERVLNMLKTFKVSIRNTVVSYNLSLIHI